MADKFLYEELDSFSKLGGLKRETPEYLGTFHGMLFYH